MKKVYIPIIVILLAVCVSTSIQCQAANWQLQGYQAVVQSLTSQVESLQLVIAQQQSEIQALEAETEFTDVQIANLISAVGSAAFQFYYMSLAEQRYGVSDLEEYLNRWQWTEGAYVAGAFDCSEMSAYLERKLENEGYNTFIAVGDSPFGSGGHAWLLVQAEVEGYMPVEPTTYSIVYWSDPHFDDYFVYDYVFENIHEALDYSPDEFDWWN